jgi:subfamily B ATP-binding cassette protein MsbA
MTTRSDLRKQYRQFLRLCGRTVSAQPWLFVAFVGLATAAALSEGLGVGLLIPLLQQAAPGTGGYLPWVDETLARLLPTDPGGKTVALAGALMLVIVARGLLLVASAYAAIMLPLKVHTRLSTSTYDAVLDANLDFFAKADGGVLRTLVQEYPHRMAEAIRAVTDVVASAILATIYLALMLLVSWKMTLIAIILVGLAGVIIRSLLTTPLGRTGAALSTVQERWNTQIHETSLGLKLIRLLGAEPVMRRAYGSVIRDYVHHDAMRQLIGQAQAPVMTTFGGLFVCGMLIYGAGWATGVNTAQLIVLVLCLYRLTGPASRIMTNLVVVTANLDALWRQDEFARSTAAARPADGSLKFERLRNDIRFSNVTFRYPDSDRNALADFDLTIRRGEMIALVGPSGAGKTSVVNLLGRLYEPQLGSIEIDAVDLRNYQIASWRHRIAVVTQDITLFNMSVADNLTFGLDDITQTQLESAARHAAALGFIEELPEGWNTRLGDRGVRLSGGQQQRLSIARAALRDPELLILDEATSQLDTITEQSIQNMIESYRGERTILVVAHRLSTIRRADRIAVMRNGRVIELGSHEELAARDSHYRTMLNAQQLEVDLAS